MTATPVVTRSAPVSAAQHKAALWADEGQQVFAVVMGSRIPDLPGRIEAADLEDHDCLLPGALEPERRQTAPYLLRLKRDSPFTDWLLFEAPASLAEWGVLVRSNARMTVLRNHLRDPLQARLPTGQQIGLDWMDPEILAALLAHSDPISLRNFFGPVAAFSVAGAQGWRHLSLELGRLQQVEAPLASAA